MNNNTFIPAGARTASGAQGFDNIAEQSHFWLPESLEERMKRKHEEDLQRERIIQEFKAMDKNEDNFITKDEVCNFFRDKKKVNIEDERFISDVFEQVDADGNGRISIDEYVNFYMSNFLRLEDRRQQCQQQIVNHFNQRNDVLGKYQEAEIEENQPGVMNEYQIRSDSRLKVHIVDAQNLSGQGSYVVVQHANLEEQTSVQPRPEMGGEGDPIWNQAIVFAVEDPSIPVNFQLKNAAGGLIFQDSINLKNDVNPEWESNYMLYDNMGKDVLLPRDQEESQYDEFAPRLRVRLHFHFSNLERYDQALHDWDRYIEDDFRELDNVRHVQKNMANPFELKIESQKGPGNEDLDQQDMDDIEEQENIKTDLQQFEKGQEQQLDALAKTLSRQAGYSIVPWSGLFKFLLAGQFLLSCLSCYYKPDFLTLTAVCICTFYVNIPEYCARARFRSIVGLVFLSILYDVIWILFLTRYADESDGEGNTEVKVKRFSLNVTYISLVWRTILAIVSWKVSLDFVKLFKGKDYNGNSLKTLNEYVKEIRDILRQDQLEIESDHFSDQE